MRQQRSVVFWFCLGAALILAMFGVWNYFAGTPDSVLRLCFKFAALFFIAAIVFRWTVQWAERKATVDG